MTLSFSTVFTAGSKAAEKDIGKKIQGVWTLEYMDVGNSENRRTRTDAQFMMYIMKKHYMWRWGNLELRYDHAHAELFDIRFVPGHAQDVAQAEVGPGPSPPVIRLVGIRLGFGNSVWHGLRIGLIS